MDMGIDDWEEDTPLYDDHTDEPNSEEDESEWSN